MNDVDLTIANPDPFAVSAGDVPDVKFPLLPAGSLHRMRLIGFDRGDSKTVGEDGKPRQTLTITLETTVETLSIEGKPLHPGHKVRERFGITPTEKMTVREIIEKVSMPIKAVLGRNGALEHQISDLLADPTPLLNKLVDVQVGIEVDKRGEFPDKNKVQKWIIPA